MLSTQPLLSRSFKKCKNKKSACSRKRSDDNRKIHSEEENSNNMMLYSTTASTNISTIKGNLLHQRTFLIRILYILFICIVFSLYYTHCNIVQMINNGSMALLRKKVSQKINTLNLEASLLNNNSRSSIKIHQNHNEPTLLSIFDHNNDEFIRSSENELYQLFNSPTIKMSYAKKQWMERIHLKLNKYKINSFHESIQVNIEIEYPHSHESYTDFSITSDGKNDDHYERNNDGTTKSSGNKDDRKRGINVNNLLNDNDMLAMHCSSKSDLYKKPMEVATLAQVLATSSFHYKNNPNFEWGSAYTLYIPSFPIVREEVCYFVLYRKEEKDDEDDNDDNDDSMLILAKSDFLELPSLDTPTGIHLSLSNDPTEMIVNFATGLNGDPFVEVTHPNGEKTNRYECQTSTYTNKDLCQAPANSTDIGHFIPPGYLHSVTLDALKPDTQYSYRVGLRKEGKDEIVYAEESYTFTTVPIIGSKDPFAFIAFGDQGCPDDGWAMGGNMSTRMIERELDNANIPIKNVHHFGDLSYARGNAHIWDAWLNMIQVYTSRVPLLVGVGNHEYDHTEGGLDKDPSKEPTDAGFHPIWGNFGTDSGGECGVPTAMRFSSPNNGNGVFWYSYDLGLVHTIMISSEHSLYRDSRQYKWLENDLKNIDRTLTPWVVIECHRPLYHSEYILSELVVQINMRFEFEDLLEKYGVDLFLSGHYHSYLRTCNGLYRSKCNNGGPTHITVGTAGAKLDWGFLIPSGWTEKFLKVWGYGKVTVYNETALHWSFISAQGENEGKSLDEAWILKQ